MIGTSNIPSSNISNDIAILTGLVRGIPQFLQAKAVIESEIRSLHLPSILFLINYSLVMISFNVI
jgi:hypothetical protein